jgi:hypothetical protein
MLPPMARRLRIAGVRRSATQSGPIYRVAQCLRDGHTADVPGTEIATTVSAWLAELGADSPLVEDLAKAVRTNDWPAAHAIGDYLAINVTVAAA